MENILEIKGLTKYYNEVLGVKDLNLTLKQGEVFGFIGPNGAGKSTTIRTILNLINKTSGEVLFNGKPLENDSIQLKEFIGYLSSEVCLYDDLTVQEMLDFHASFYKKNTNKRRKELVEKLNLDETKKIEELSLGNLKKLGIVLAFMHEPKLLILDEPTNGLDPIMQQVFFELLTEEKKKGTTVFYSTHILSEISKTCDRVGIIKEGQLLKIETIKELLEKNLTYVTISSEDVQQLIVEFKNNIISSYDKTIVLKNTMDSNTLIKILSKYNIEKLLIEQAPLEDIFLHYYRQEEKNV